MPKTQEEFYERCVITVCPCFANKRKELRRIGTPWKLFGAGIDLNSKIRTLDIACKGCGSCCRVICEGQ